MTEVTAETAGRILYLSAEAVNDLCEKGALRARRTGKGGPWQIDYGSIIEYHNANPSSGSKAK